MTQMRVRHLVEKKPRPAKCGAMFSFALREAGAAHVSVGVKNGPDSPETPFPVHPEQRTSSDRPGMRVVLTVCRSLPVYPDKLTISKPVGTSQKCQTATLRRQLAMKEAAN